MALLCLLYAGQGLYYARTLAPSGDMVQYLAAGRLAVMGEISLYDDRLPGNRAPLPFYVLGLTQVLAGGPSLLAARWLNVGFGLLTLLLTAALARRLAGQAAGLLAALFLATQGVVVAYYSYEGYPAFAAFCLMAGLFVFLGGDSPRRHVLGLFLLGLLFFVRSNLWPAIPFFLAFALWRARGSAHRALLVGMVALPPLLFLAWDPRHLKLLAYVPVLRRLVAPLGYVSALVLDDREILPLAAQLSEVARLIRRYEFWVLATVVLLALLAWQRVTGRQMERVTGEPKVVFLTALFGYMLGTQFLIYYWNWKWVGVYFLSFAPLVALLLGIRFSWLLTTAPPGSRARRFLIIVLAFLLLPPLYFVRNPLLAASEARAANPLVATHRLASHLARVVPRDAKVFFYGWNVAYYLSGLPSTYLQQFYSDWHLAGGSFDEWILRRSGFVPIGDLARWLSVEADYAVIDPGYIEAHRNQFRDAIRTMEALLHRHFEKVASVGEQGPFTYDIYRRKAAGEDI